MTVRAKNGICIITKRDLSIMISTLFPRLKKWGKGYGMWGLNIFFVGKNEGQGLLNKT